MFFFPVFCAQAVKHVTVIAANVNKILFIIVSVYLISHLSIARGQICKTWCFSVQ